jgi:hypothetical protein
MGKTKQLKKLMEAEAELIHERLNTLTSELAEVKRNAAKAAHPSGMTLAEPNWSDLEDGEYAAAAEAAKKRAAQPKPHRKRVIFKRVRSDLHGPSFVLDGETLTTLAQMGVGYSFTPVQRGNMNAGYNMQFTHFITRDNVGELAKRVNQLLPNGQKVYAEVQILG